jgi:hypothetical protein
MYTATMLFLGLAVCTLAFAVCYALANREKTVNPNQLSADEKKIWTQIKSVMCELNSRYEKKMTRKQLILRSWAGTFAICAGLCLVGIVMEVKYRHPINTKNVVAAFAGDTNVAVPANDNYTKASTHNNTQPQNKNWHQTQKSTNGHTNNVQPNATTNSQTGYNGNSNWQRNTATNDTPTNKTGNNWQQKATTNTSTTNSTTNNQSTK